MSLEYVVLVDEKNRQIGVAEKLSTHHDNTPLHRAFSCYIFNDKNQLLVTKRADIKKVWPGVWTNSVCGHPMPDESMKDAIKRRMSYELGMTADDLKLIVADYTYKTPPFNGIIENEFCPVYIARASSNPNPNADEVGDYKWMDWEDYKKQLADDKEDVYSWWCKDQLKHIENYIDNMTGKYDFDIASTRKEVDRRLKVFLSEKIDLASKISEHYETLWRFVDESITAGGKRIRPYIVLLAYSAYVDSKDKNFEVAYSTGLAMELLHNAMLVHDDIIDKDLVRHGVDNVAGRYIKLYAKDINDEKRIHHYADSAAIIAGDLLISSSRSLISSNPDIDNEVLVKISELMDEAIFRVCGGELLDTEASFRDSRASAMTIASEKTSSYSFEIPLAVGATLAGASESEIESLSREFGRSLGIAFQIQDDILGVFGDEAILGKSTSGDIREGKRTYMVEKFYEMASDEQKSNFELAFGNDNATHEEEGLARSALKDSGALEATKSEISRLANYMQEVVEKLSISAEYKKLLIDLMDLCIKRDF